MKTRSRHTQRGKRVKLLNYEQQATAECKKRGMWLLVEVERSERFDRQLTRKWTIYDAVLGYKLATYYPATHNCFLSGLDEPEKLRWFHAVIAAEKSKRRRVSAVE